MKKVVGIVAVLMVLVWAGCKKENSCGCEEAFENARPTLTYTGNIFDSIQNTITVRTTSRIAFTPDAANGENNIICPMLKLYIDTSGGHEIYFDKPVNVTFTVFDGSTVLYSGTHSYSNYTYELWGSYHIALLLCGCSNDISWDWGTAPSGHYTTETKVEFCDGSTILDKDIICLIRSKCCDSDIFYQRLNYIDGHDMDLIYNSHLLQNVKYCN